MINGAHAILVVELSKSVSSLPASATGSTATASVQWHVQASQLLCTY